MKDRYSRLTIVLHWGTALAVSAAYIASEGGPDIRADPPRLHIAFGISVLVLVITRILARVLSHAPPPLISEARFSRLAQVAHILLYALLVLVPLSGWFTASRLGLSARIAGVALPALTSEVAGPPGLIADMHQVGGNCLIILAALHAAIALWHHFVAKDRVLQRMNPF